MPESSTESLRAAESLAGLHDELVETGYTGHALEVLLVRLVFCLFAQDTGILGEGQFENLLRERSRTKADESDAEAETPNAGELLVALFEVLGTPEEERDELELGQSISANVLAFPYVGEALFFEHLPAPPFSEPMTEHLLAASALQWKDISPCILGNLLQCAMDRSERRQLGAHYTSDRNILKLIELLFLDELRAEFERAKDSPKRLATFHEKLASLTFFDPACGCGDFLVVSYRELRRLELRVLRALHPDGQGYLDIRTLVRVDVSQFFGIEIEEFPARITQLAMWIVDHQMNHEVGAAFGKYFLRLPLESSADIRAANALSLEWSQLIAPSKLNYVLGNPPFVGAKHLSESQRAGMQATVGTLKNYGLLDYVSAWYLKAARLIEGSRAEIGFVSTNSITQGEQVGVLWPELFRMGLHLNFAHQTFEWESDARGKAAVHCVIIGLATRPRAEKFLFEYASRLAEPTRRKVKSISPYLVEGPATVVRRHSRPPSDAPSIGIGNKPIDGGHYLFGREERDAFLREEPAAEPHFRRWLGAVEFLQGKERWCLWLGDQTQDTLTALPRCRARIEAVREFRKASQSPPTQRLAETPTRFHVENMPKKRYLVVPKTSSQRRAYLPIGYVEPAVLAGDALFIIDDATPFHFGVLSSRMHMAWLRAVGGRLKSDYRYSASVVYNAFPWPADVDGTKRDAVVQAANAVLAARAEASRAQAQDEDASAPSLATLYDPDKMPAPLASAHADLDDAVERCYGARASLESERERIEFLLNAYAERTAES